VGQPHQSSSRRRRDDDSGLEALAAHSRWPSLASVGDAHEEIPSEAGRGGGRQDSKRTWNPLLPPQVRCLLPFHNSIHFPTEPCDAPSIHALMLLALPEVERERRRRPLPGAGKAGQHPRACGGAVGRGFAGRGPRVVSYPHHPPPPRPAASCGGPTG
jgi:hypothetical protein